MSAKTLVQQTPHPPRPRLLKYCPYCGTNLLLRPPMYSWQSGPRHSKRSPAKLRLTSGGVLYCSLIYCPAEKSSAHIILPPSFEKSI
jgi:hypothetical protein